jgi:hypothetical protein
MHDHNTPPGPPGLIVGQRPGPARFPHNRDRHTLIMAVHPGCPCTRISVSEPASILTRCEGRVEVYVLIFTPERGDEAWRPIEGLRRLGTIAGVHLIEDRGGAEAARFGARTSGHVASHAPDGPLVFRGGITSVRDHDGDMPASRRSSPWTPAPPPHRPRVEGA